MWGGSDLAGSLFAGGAWSQRMEEERKSGWEMAFTCVPLLFSWVCEPSHRALFGLSWLGWFSVIYNPGP